jgi:hypothetical protein
MSDLHKRKRIMKHLMKKKQKQPAKEKSRTDLQKKRSLLSNKTGTTYKKRRT